MENATRLTSLEVTGDLDVKGSMTASGLDEDTYLAVSPDAAEAAGSAPTAAEFNAVVTLVNELKANHNKLTKRLITGADQ